MFVLMISLSSCNDYLDVNNSTNYPHTSDVNPPAFLANALSTTFRTQATTMNEYGNLMTNAWSGNTSVYTQPFSTEFTRNLTTTTREGIFNGFYTGMSLFNKIIVYPNPNGDYDNYAAIAKIMKSYYMQYIVDLYGNTPYSKAFLGEANQAPSYDSDKQIYTSLLLQLEEAKSLITNAPSNATIPGSEDIVYAGSMTEWTKFANTIELKMCLRMSNVSDPTMVALRDQYLGYLNGASFVDANVTINPGYNNSTIAQYNPFSLFYSRIYDAAAGQITYDNNYNGRLVCASDYMAKVLNATVNQPGVIVNNSGSAKDPRRTRMFRSAGTIVGIAQGAGATTVGPSLIGSGLTGFAGVSGPDAFSNAESKDGFLMTLSESLFLQAEAEFRSQNGINNFNGGADLGLGDPQNLFNLAVTASFDFYELPTGSYVPAPLSPNASTYLGSGSTGIDNKLGLGWSGTSDKIQVIITQKWLALSGINGIESYFDRLRTGFPNNPYPITATPSDLPKRLLYPSGEYSNNPSNVPILNLSQLFTVNSSTPFWQN